MSLQCNGECDEKSVVERGRELKEMKCTLLVVFGTPTPVPQSDTQY